MPTTRHPTIVHLVNSLTGGGTERTLVSLLHKMKPRTARHVVVTLREAGELAVTLPDDVACRPLTNQASVLATTERRHSCRVHPGSEPRDSSRAQPPVSEPRHSCRAQPGSEPNDSSRAHPPGEHRTRPATGRSWSTGFRLARVVKHLAADVLHARNTGCWADAVVAGLLNPRVAIVLGFHGLEHDGTFDRRSRLIARLAAFIGATFTSVSNAGRDKLIRECNIRSDKITVLPNGVDLTRFAPADAAARAETRKKLGLRPQDVVFGTVGALVPVKRHDLLLDAFATVAAQIPEAKLLIVGEGPCRQKIQEQVRRCPAFECSAGSESGTAPDCDSDSSSDAGFEHDASSGCGTGFQSGSPSTDEPHANRVLMPGSASDIRPYLAAMDAYVCSSDSEGISNALLEALASGLPIITTDVGDHASIVRTGREGIIVPPGGTADLSAAMLKLARDGDHRVALATAARGRAEELGSVHKVEAYANLYRELAHPTSNPFVERSLSARDLPRGVPGDDEKPPCPGCEVMRVAEC